MTMIDQSRSAIASEESGARRLATLTSRAKSDTTIGYHITYKQYIRFINLKLQWNIIICHEIVEQLSVTNLETRTPMH